MENSLSREAGQAEMQRGSSEGVALKPTPTSQAPGSLAVLVPSVPILKTEQLRNHVIFPVDLHCSPKKVPMLFSSQSNILQIRKCVSQEIMREFY